MGINAPYGWITLIARPSCFSLLFFITAYPTPGKQAIASRGDDYRDYQRNEQHVFPAPEGIVTALSRLS